MTHDEKADVVLMYQEFIKDVLGTAIFQEISKSPEYAQWAVKWSKYIL